MSHSNKCILAPICRQRDTQTCTPICSHYVSMHGTSGKGGRLGSADVPRDYRLLTVTKNPARDTLVTIGGKREAVGYFADRYAGTFHRQFNESADRIKSVYLFSTEPGTGKTTTACSLLNTYAITNYLGSLKRGVRPQDRPTYFLSMNELQALFNRAYSPSSLSTKEQAGDEFNRRLDIAKSVPYLAVDDIGVRKASTAFISQIYDLFDHRTSEGMPSIFTSNLSLAELKELFRDEDPQGKVVDRIRDMTVAISFEGNQSKRGKR